MELDLTMKVVVCRCCGIAMYAVVYTCLRCKQSKLNYHDLYIGQNGMDLERRIAELTSPYQPKYAQPLISMLIVFGIALSGAGWHQYCFHPEGYVAQTANAYIDLGQKSLASNLLKPAKTM